MRAGARERDARRNMMKKSTGMAARYFQTGRSRVYSTALVRYLCRM